MSNLNVVHESEAQRQHVRVRLPGFIEFAAGREHCRLKLVDLSAGGIAFESAKRAFRVGEAFRGNLIVNLDGMALGIPVGFQVRNVDGSGRVGAQFRDLGPREISALRHLITSFLAGETVAAGDVLQTVKRDNFTRPRTERRTAPQASGSRTGTLLTTLAITAVGVLAFFWVAGQMNRTMFATTAVAAKVAGPVFTIEMPREGTFRSLVPEDGLVKKGAAIASFEAPAFDLVRQQAAASSLSPEQLQKMLGVNIRGTITSPCDCRVQARFVADDQYVSRGEPLFELMPAKFTPHLVARFRYDQMDDVEQGGYASFRVNGDGDTRIGKITRIRAAGERDSVESDVLVNIEPLEPLPPELLQRPAEVMVGGISMAELAPLLVDEAEAEPAPERADEAPREQAQAPAADVADESEPQPNP